MEGQTDTVQDKQVDALGTIVGALRTIETALGTLEGDERTEALELTAKRIGRTLAAFKPEKQPRQARNGKAPK